MAALTITASAISSNSSISGILPSITTGTAGATITQGMSVYKKLADGLIYPTDSNSSDAEAAAVGISLSSALTGQPIVFQNAGPINFGAILLAGKWYVAGATVAGDINPIADLTTGWRSTLLFYGYSTSIGVIPTQGPIVTGITCA
jgi:hypothetical protein